jgi:hypothetical protein
MGIEVGADLWHMGNIAGRKFFFKAPEIPFSRWINPPHVNSYMFVAAKATPHNDQDQGRMSACEELRPVRRQRLIPLSQVGLDMVCRHP